MYLLSKLTEDREVCVGLGAGRAEPGGRVGRDLPCPCSLLFPWWLPLVDPQPQARGTEITHVHPRGSGS